MSTQTITHQITIHVEEKKSPKKQMPNKLTEEEKIADPKNYIRNPKTGNMVLRTSPLGKSIEMIGEIQTAEMVDEKMNLEYETLRFEHDSLKYKYEQLRQEHELLKGQIKSIMDSFGQLNV
jgi:hypothetical protein